MVRRVSQEVGIYGGDNTPDVQQYQGANYRPDPVSAPDDDSILQGILSLGAQVAEQKFNESAQEAYLRGGIAAAQGQSAENVTNDPFVRQFAYGGFNDENYRLVQAKEAQTFQTWLQQEGHKYAPDDPRVSEALASASNNTMQAITPNMTGRARAEALMSQNKTNEVLVTQHNKAYKDYVVKSAAERLLPQGNKIISNLTTAMAGNDQATYMASTDAAALFFTDVSNNPDLPEDMRQEISVQFLNSMLNADQRTPVEEMRSAGMLDKLPFETREKIDTAIRNSKGRTEVRDLGNRIADNAFFEQAASEGQKSVQEINDYVQQGYKDGWMTVAHAMGLFDKAAKSSANAQLTRDTLAALNRRDIPGLHSLNTNSLDAMALLDEQLKKGKMSAQDRLGTMTSLGLDLGEFPKSYAQMISSAAKAVGGAAPGEPVSPEFTGALNIFTNLVVTANKTSPNKTQILLDNLPENTKGAVAYMLTQAEFGVPVDESLRTFWANNEEIKKLQGAKKERHTQTWREQYSAAINKEFPRSYFSNFWRGLVGDTQRIDDSTSANNVILSKVWEEMRFQENKEANFGVDEDSLVQIASSAVRQRTIPITGEGETSKAYPLIVERGVDIQSMFGTTDRRLIGSALAKAYPPANEKLKSVFIWDSVNKQVVNQQLDEQGNYVDKVAVPADAIKEYITTVETAKAAEQVALNFGAPRKVGNSLLVVDGRNSANVAPNVAMAARDLMIKASPELTEQFIQEDPATASARFRDESDLVLSRAVRHIAPRYVSAAAQAAIAAAVASEGDDVMLKVVARATKALDVQDAAGFDAAVNLVENETLREELRRVLPTGRTVGIIDKLNRIMPPAPPRQ